MPDDELGVGGLLPGLEAALGEADARLQFVVEDAAVAHHEEEVLLVTLRRLALHVPVVFPGGRMRKKEVEVNVIFFPSSA